MPRVDGVEATGRHVRSRQVTWPKVIVLTTLRPVTASRWCRPEGPGSRRPCVPGWWAHGEQFPPFLAFPPEVRRVIYKTNLIESMNARLRKVTRNRGQFPREQAALKVLYLVPHQSTFARATMRRSLARDRRPSRQTGKQASATMARRSPTARSERPTPGCQPRS